MRSSDRSILPGFLILLVFAAAASAAWILSRWNSPGYWTLPVGDRPFHPAHGSLRSSGRVGLLLGIGGTALMGMNLGYLVRKRLLRIAWLGPLRRWMSLHVLTGIVGPALIVLHSGFAPTSALGTLAFAAMSAAVAAGIVGRYIYSLVPRSLEGREMELGEVRRELEECRRRLEGLGAAAILEIGPEPAARDREAGFLPSALSAIRSGIQGRREYRRLRRALLASPETRRHAREILPLVRRLARTRQWIARYRDLRSVMGSWRFFHRWLAILTLLVAAFHVVVAMEFGDLWILGRSR